MAPNGPSARAAFTLMELLVVISIMVLLLGISAAAIAPFMSGRQLDAGARVVQSMIYQARTYAATQRCAATLYFDSVNRSMTLFNSPVGVPGMIDNRVAQPEFLPAGAKFGVSGPGIQPVVIRSPGTVTSARKERLVFTPSGSLDPSYAGMGGVGNWQVWLVRESAADTNSDGLIGPEDNAVRVVLEVVFASGLVRVREQ